MINWPWDMLSLKQCRQLLLKMELFSLVGFSEEQTLRSSVVCTVFTRLYPWHWYVKVKARKRYWVEGEVEL